MKFIVSLSNPDTGVVFVKEGDRDYRLNCSSSEQPIIWYKNNIPIQSTSRVEIMNNGQLKFSRISATQAGWYTCASNTSLGLIEEDFLLIVGGELFVNMHVEMARLHFLYKQ